MALIVVAIAVAALGIAALTLRVRSAHGVAATSLTSQRIYGQQTDAALTLDPAGSAAKPEFPEAEARHIGTHPFVAPDVRQPAAFSGLARVRARLDVTSPEGGAASALDGTLAYVTVYQARIGGDTNCPAEVPSQRHLPPVFPHYYFAVIVNASTGAESDWQEDQSGYILRECIKALQSGR